VRFSVKGFVIVTAVVVVVVAVGVGIMDGNHVLARSAYRQFKFLPVFPR
jgi:hypothetical protein